MFYLVIDGFDELRLEDRYELALFLQEIIDFEINIRLLILDRRDIDLECSLNEDSFRSIQNERRKIFESSSKIDSESDGQISLRIQSSII